MYSSSAFFLGELSIIHWYGCLEFDPDEGINLMKAFLVNDGYSLYQEIWNDQPPILTHILGWGINIFGAKVQFLRGLILIFSTLLLWQMWLILYLLGESYMLILAACFYSWLLTIGS